MPVSTIYALWKQQLFHGNANLSRHDVLITLAWSRKFMALHSPFYLPGRLSIHFDLGGKVRGKALYHLTTRHLVSTDSCLYYQRMKKEEGGKKGWLKQQNFLLFPRNKTAPLNAGFVPDLYDTKAITMQ